MALTQIDDRGLKTPIDLIDNESIRFGTGNDLAIYHDGTDSYITSATGELRVYSNGGILRMRAKANENAIIAVPDGGVQLYYNNVNKAETHGNGLNVNGRLYVTSHINLDDATGGEVGKLLIGGGDDLQIYHDGSNSFIKNSTNSCVFLGGMLQINDLANAKASATFDTDGSVELYHNNFKSFETWSNGIYVYGPEGGGGIIRLYADEGDDDADKWDFNANTDGTLLVRSYTSGSWVTKFRVKSTGEIQIPNDTGKYECGSSGDLQIYHDGSNSYLKNTTGDFRFDASGPLMLRSDDIRGYNAAGDEFIFRGLANGSVSLYYDNNLKLTTVTDGVRIDNGNLRLDRDDAYIKLGAGNDLQIWHDGSNSHISDRSGTGALRISSDNLVEIKEADANNWSAKFNIGAGVDLYHNNSKVLETLGNGVRVQGGVMFGSDTADANRITDYEQGTFTPQIRANLNTNGSQDGTGTYVKIGKQVHIHVNIGNKTLTGFPGSPGTIRIDGLPFVANHNVGDEFGMSSKMIVMGVDSHSEDGYFRTQNGESYLLGYYNTNNAVWSAWSASAWDNSGVYLIFNMTYFTNS